MNKKKKKKREALAFLLYLKAGRFVKNETIPFRLTKECVSVERKKATHSFLKSIVAQKILVKQIIRRDAPTGMLLFFES